jgi:CubicO group peptidase (beta-lactamase class C family)
MGGRLEARVITAAAPGRVMCLLLVAALVSCGLPVGSRQIGDQVPRVDAYLDQLAREGQFSGSVLVAQNGEIQLSQGYGWADIENQVPNTPQTRFRIHWLTMPFTALGILMLQAQNKLDVQDPICDYITDCPEYWQGITIHHLLTHTAGLSDYVQPWHGDSDRPANSPQLIDRFKGKPPYFPPGEDLRYSANGYIVLGHIIERVSGETYESFLRREVFEPLGMENTGYGHHSQMAAGYRPVRDRASIGDRAPVPDLLFRYSAGGLYSSAEDLYRWDRALHNEELLPREYLDLMFTGYTRTPSVDIDEADYGYGWFVGRVLDRPALVHAGVGTGFAATLLRFPREQVTIIVLRNYGLDLYGRLEIELARMLFEESG